MADRNYVSSDFAAKLERARKRVQRTAQPRRQVPPPPAPPQVSSVFRVNNREPEPIPQFAVMEVEGLDDVTGFSGDTREAYQVVQASTSGYLYMVNSGDEIPYTHFGGGVFATEPTKILIDPTANPNFGDRFGAASGHWYVTPNIAGTLMYLGQNDGETGIFLDVERAIDSLVIGVTIASTADTFATITSRPPGWPEVPGEAASVVQITNPSSIAISSTGFNCHAVYSRRNDADSWELIGGGGSAGQEPAYGSMTLPSTSLDGNGAAYQQVPLRQPLVTAYGLTASTATFDFTAITEGDYEIQYHTDVALPSVGSTEFTAIFGVFRNGSGVDGWARHFLVRNSSGKRAWQAGAASGILHLEAGDAVDLRVLIGSSNDSLDITKAGMSVSLIRATTST